MIRQATPQDAPKTLAFRTALLKENLETIFEAAPPSLEAQQHWHQTFEEDDNAVLFVCEKEETIIGLLGFQSFASTPQCKHAGAFGISVHHDHRGQGIGSQLLSALIDWAAHHAQIRRLELEVFSNNPRAQKLYARHGFQVEGTKKRAVYVRGSYIDSIVMALWVDRLDV